MNFNRPQHCEFHKFILVDELALCKNPALIHYGKCSVIGFLSSSDRLGSLTIPNIEKCYQLRDCALSVRLFMDFHPSNFMHSTVEVCGEVRLFDSTKQELKVRDLESSHSLIERLRNLQMTLEESRGLPARPPSGTNDQSLHFAVKGRLQKEIEEFRLKYKPVIQVSTIRHVTEARAIIVENLRYRQIQNARKKRLKT